MMNKNRILLRDRYFESAVMICIANIDGKDYFILEKRAKNIRQAGEISFPGGKKSLVGYGIAIPLILIGLFEVYSYTIYHKWYLLLIGIIFLGIGLKQLKTVLTYSYVIDTETKNLKFGN